MLSPVTTWQLCKVANMAASVYKFYYLPPYFPLLLSFTSLTSVWFGRDCGAILKHPKLRRERKALDCKQIKFIDAFLFPFSLHHAKIASFSFRGDRRANINRSSRFWKGRSFQGKIKKCLILVMFSYVQISRFPIFKTPTRFWVVGAGLYKSLIANFNWKLMPKIVAYKGIYIKFCQYYMVFVLGYTHWMLSDRQCHLLGVRYWTILADQFIWKNAALKQPYFPSEVRWFAEASCLIK